jgi:hypothetical protein
MGATHVKGRDLVVKHPPVVLYTIFSDLRRFAENLPVDLKDKVRIEADSIVGSVQGMEMGLRVDQRIPYSLISFAETGKFPFPFKFYFHFSPVGLDSTLFHLELEAELPTMVKMMVGGKLQEMVDKVTDQLEQAFNGKIPQEYNGYQNS